MKRVTFSTNVLTSPVWGIHCCKASSRTKRTEAEGSTVVGVAVGAGVFVAVGKGVGGTAVLVAVGVGEATEVAVSIAKTFAVKVGRGVTSIVSRSGWQVASKRTQMEKSRALVVI